MLEKIERKKNRKFTLPSRLFNNEEKLTLKIESVMLYSKKIAEISKSPNFSEEESKELLEIVNEL